MVKGGLTDTSLPEYSWKEVAEHKQRDNRWIVIDGYIYDVTLWGKRHPGGEKIIGGYAGQDASEAWYAFHPHKAYVGKFMKSLVVGRVPETATDSPLADKRTLALLEDYHELRDKVEKMGLYRPNFTFFALIAAHVVFFDLLGWWTMKTFGTGWLPYVIASVLLATAQIQAGWAQHDYGHLSVFQSSRLNHWVQLFMLNFMKGASCDWWNFRHLNHHSKPNVLTKDPDVTFDPLLLVGKSIAIEYGQKKIKYLPYDSQHKYFFFVLPPLLLPLYFNLEIPYFLIKRKQWMELFWMSLFFLRWQLMFGAMLGIGGVFLLYIFVRFLESHWFVWATQMSHLPMHIDYDGHTDWVTTQLRASCNVEHSFFNDWWSGHLNFQIEHHLFPTMPRHNLIKAAPMVKAFCEKHGLVYQNKPALTAFADIVRSLRDCGQLWLEAYNM